MAVTQKARVALDTALFQALGEEFPLSAEGSVRAYWAMEQYSFVPCQKRYSS